MNTVLFFTLLFATFVTAHEQESSSTFLTAEDFQRAESNDFSNAPFNESILTNPDLIEGDIKDSHVSLEGLSPDERARAFEAMESRFYGNALRDKNALWPGGRVPYQLYGQFDRDEKAAIAKAFSEYKKKTCIRIVKREPSDNDYILIVRARGCFSNIGRIGGEQQLSLGQGCGSTGVVEHEFMHAIGFHHEQNRADRDEYVDVYFQNIQPSMRFNFKKETLQTITHLNTPYDYGSVMHYGNKYFSINGQPTIISKQDRRMELGQRNGFSQNDILKINRLYCGDNSGSENECEDSKTTCSDYVSRKGCLTEKVNTLCRKSCRICT